MLLSKVSLPKLKERSLKLHDDLLFDTGWFNCRRIRKELALISDEIDYQEGRKQFANRPYSKPTMLRADEVVNCPPRK